MPVNFDLIPAEFKALRQWCVYKLEVVGGKKTKVPYQISGDSASSTDPTTWATFESARDAYQDLEKFDGICFMLSEDNGIVFVDLDDCIKGGNIESWAVEIVRRLNSYTERSQSGKGLHILIKGQKPGARCRRADYPHKIEIYSHSRQCCFTGDVVGSV
jgi:putative DNA primase/helicase